MEIAINSKSHHIGIEKYDEGARHTLMTRKHGELDTIQKNQATKRNQARRVIL
jgi:hypothetical protein